MKHCLLLLLPLLICVSVSGQNTNPVAHSDLITFMDSLQVNDTMKINNLSSFNGLNDVLEDTLRFFHDTLFTADDKRFFRKQLASYQGKEWTDSDRITGITVIPQPTINAYAINGQSGWKKFRSKYGKGYKVISFPLFTTDMNTAVVAKSYHILKVTTGSLHLYKKVNGQWKDTKVYSTWKG